MQRLNEIVDFYLRADTNYAIMITGEWGVGKTYYFKTILKKQISETPTYENNQKNYKPILISLFGLKSLEEIQTEIFLSLYPILKNKAVKLGGSIGKALIKGIMHLKNVGEYYEYVSDIEIGKGDWINFGDLVICFDDLERLSDNLNIEEFIGYVNSLVENENVKVLIIANENKIDKSNYFALKEKVVGNSIEFIPDFGNSFDSLVESKFIGSPNYKTFLNTNKAYILGIYTKTSNNLRILSFVLSYFHSIYSNISNSLTTDDILKEKEKEILLKLLKFSLAVSIEYKAGRISFTKRENLDWNTGFDMSTLSFNNIQFGNKKEKNEQEITFREKFINQYYVGDNYSYFNSIYGFITGGSILKIDDLIQDLKNHYHIKENEILPQYEVFNKLCYPEVFSLSDTEYKRLTRELLVFCDKGNFAITDYLTVFYFALRFKNPLKYMESKLEQRVIKGMEKGRDTYEYNHSLDFYINIDSKSEHRESLFRIKQAALDLNKKIDSAKKAADAFRMEKLYAKEFKTFSLEVLSIEKPYLYTPILQLFNVNKFYFFFMRSDNLLRWDILRFFKARYKDFPSDYLKPEIIFLESLQIKLFARKNSSQKKGISFFVIDELNQVLLSAIKQLNAMN